MKIIGFLSSGRIAMLASIAAVGAAAVGGYHLSTSGIVGYSCEGLMLPKAAAAAYLERVGSKESLDASKTCIAQFALKRPAAGVEEEEEEGVKATDRPDEAIRFRALTLRDENGRIPFDGVIKAADHAKTMQAAEKASGDAKQITRTSWIWLGPGNIGGRSRALVINPNAPLTMYLGSVGGGVWKTTNGGTTWQPLGNFLANLAVSTLIMHPTNPNILFAGTGEGFHNADAIRGAGILKSINGGTSWVRLASTNNQNFHYVNRLAISANGLRLLAATRLGIFRSTDGGANWTPSLSPAEETLDVRFHPTNNLLAVLGGRNGRAWWSNNGGQTWTQATGLPSLTGFDGRVELAYSRSNPLIVYASVDTGGTSSGAVYKSTNGGHSYTLVNSGTGYLGGQGWYDNTIWVDPTNPNVVVVGGIDLWRSVNGGSILTKISNWQAWYDGTSAHADQHGIVAHPGYNGTSNRIVFVVNDGGIYRAGNIGTVAQTSGWQEKNNNLGITQFYGAAGNPTTGEIMTGTQDNGSLFYKPTTGPQQWTLSNGGDGGFAAADPTNVNYFYNEYVFLTIARSSDRGVSSQEIYFGIGDANSCAYFIAPFILDPNNANRLLAGGCSLWRTNNAKAAGQPTWTQISPYLAPGSAVSAIAVLKGNSNVIWIAFGNGDIYKTANGTAANPIWTKVDKPNVPNRYVTRIALQSATTAYVTFGGFSPDNVWRTTNGGTSWADRTGAGATGLPDAPIRSIVIHPTHPNWLYVGTEVGVFVSENAGANWTVPHSGPANVSVDELFFLNNNVIVAATHGRGLFKSNTTTP